MAIRSTLFGLAVLFLPAFLLTGARPDPPVAALKLESGNASYDCSPTTDTDRSLEMGSDAAEAKAVPESDTTNVLDSLGAAYESLGRLAEARVQFDRALRIARKLPVPNEQLAIALTNESTVYWAMAKADQSVCYAEQAKGMWEDLKQTDRREYAIAINDLIAAYRLKGKIKDSLPVMKFAKDLYPRIFKQSDPTLAQSLSSLASSFKEAGDYVTADSLVRRALELSNVDSERPAWVRIRLLAAMADLELAEEHLPEAQHHIEQSLQLSANEPNVGKLQLANLHRSSGTVYRLSGDLPRAEEHFQIAWQLLDHSSGQAEIQRGTLSNDLALIAEERKEWKAAERLLKQALSCLEIAFGSPDHPALASTYSNLAGVYEHWHQYSKAEELYGRALALDVRALPHSHPLIGRDLNNLGSVEFHLHHYPKAEALFNESVDLFRHTLGVEHASTGLTEANLANTLSRLKRTQEAREHFRSAAETLERAWGPDDPRLVAILQAYEAFSRRTADVAEAEEIETHLVRIRVKQAIAQDRSKTSS